MHKCNFCGNELTHVFCDLGHQPPSNSFLTKEQLELPETYYPLKAYVCERCFLVQVPEVKKANDIFNEDYIYYSSQSPSNVQHAKEFADIMCDKFHLTKSSNVLEIGSNDGYLLKWFQKRGCTVLGIDPADGPADIARKNNIPTIGLPFKNEPWIRTLKPKSDLICGINVLAHQPNINNFVEGLKIILAPNGVIVFEFPYLMNLIKELQFDTIYHEHYSYFSLYTLSKVFDRHKLEIFDVEKIPEHGGSLRIYVQHKRNLYNIKLKIFGFIRVEELLLTEEEVGINNINTYIGFNKKIEGLRKNFLRFLFKSQNILAYGAAAKGNTFLNYCKVDHTILPYIVDKSKYKTGKFLPGSHIPVINEEKIRKLKPKYILILPWNLKEEIMKQLSYIKEWDGKFVVAIPKLIIKK